MFNYAVILIALGAAVGLYMAVRHFRGHTPPRGAVAALHGLLAISGVVVLLLATRDAGMRGALCWALGLFGMFTMRRRWWPWLLLPVAPGLPILWFTGDLNSALATLSYQGNLYYHGSDTLTVTTKPGKRWEKEGRRGGKLMFSESVTEYRNQDGVLCVTATSVGVQTERAVDQ